MHDVSESRDVMIVQGSRTIAEERTNIATGKSALMDPTKSKHVIIPGVRDQSDAVDATPYPVNWLDIPAFKDFGEFVKSRAKALGINIRWGGDWLQFHDYSHFERVTGAEPF